MKNLYNTSTKTIIFEYNQELDEQLNLLKNVWGGLKRGASKIPGVKTTGKSLDDLKNAKSLSPEFSSVKATTKYGAAAEVAAKDFNWSWFSGYGTKLPEAGRVLNPFKKSKPGDIKALLKYGTRLTPIPAKTSWQIYKNLGLGPLAYAWGVGALKRYIGLVYAFTLVRFVLMMGHEISKGPDNPDGNEVLRRINEFFGIPEYDGDSLYNPIDWLTNIAKSSYFPRAFWVAPGFVTLPYVKASLEWAFSSSLKGEQHFLEYVSDAHNRMGSEIDNAIGLSNGNKPPADLLNQFPSSERKNVKIDQRGGLYYKDPKYRIVNIGGSKGIGSISFGDPKYIMLIPGDGWYLIKDIDF